MIFYIKVKNILLQFKLLFPLDDEVSVDDVPPADNDDDRPRLDVGGVEDAGQQPAVDGGECGPTCGLHQHPVVVSEHQTGGQSCLVLHLLGDDSVRLAETELQEVLRHGERSKAGGDAGYARQSDGVSRPPAGPQTVRSRRLHGDERDVVPVRVVQPLEEAECQPAPSHTGDQAARPLPAQLADQLGHQAGVTGPGGRLVEGVHHEGAGLAGQLTLGSSIGLVPVVTCHNHLRSFQLAIRNVEMLQPTLSSLLSRFNDNSS